MSAKFELDRQSFGEAVVDLYRNLYDLVALRTHPLAGELVSGEPESSSDRGWQLHKLLLDAIEDLNPGPDAPAFSAPWRRYHLMLSRYVEGTGPDDVATELAISRRQFFREQKEAFEIVADLLWRRLVAPDVSQTDAEFGETNIDPASAGRLELLRVEAARVKRANRYARVDEVTEGVASIMQEVLERREITLASTLPDTMPIVSVDPSLLRQILLGVLGYLASHDRGSHIEIAASNADDQVNLEVSLAPVRLPCEVGDSGGEDQLEALTEMASLSQATLTRRCRDDRLVGFDIGLPAARRTILILDDNRDTLALFTRYLESSHYRVITSTEASEALELARDMHPDVIFLDLMMPEQDGWDVLQTLLHQPSTHDIPVVICSVLKQKTLALSLGATAFLGKPVDKPTLIATIQAVS